MSPSGFIKTFQDVKVGSISIQCICVLPVFLLLVKIVYLQSKRNQNSNLFGALEASVKLLSFQKFGAFLTLEKAFLTFLSFHSIFQEVQLTLASYCRDFLSNACPEKHIQ